MARALVTGATGFIGSHLVDALLAQGDEVVCLVRANAQLARIEGMPIELARGDLSDASALEAAVAGVDVVYHVAGQIRALSLEAFMEANAAGTRRLAEACGLRETPPTLVFVSSLAAAGPAVAGRARVETDACQPVSHYGQSKRAAELALTALADRLPISIIRPPIVFGTRDPSTKSWFQSVDRFRMHFVPGYRHRRRYSLVHSTDLVQALLAVAARGARLEIADARTESFQQGCYFVAGDEQPTYAEFGQLMGEACGHRHIAKIPLPDMLTTVLAGANELISQALRKPTIFNQDKAREIKAGHWTCSAAKLKSELRFTIGALVDRLRETALALGYGASRPREESAGAACGSQVR